MATNSNNRRKARDAGYRARYDDQPRSDNPFRRTPAFADLRAAWWEGWEEAHREHDA